MTPGGGGVQNILKINSFYLNGPLPVHHFVLNICFVILLGRFTSSEQITATSGISFRKNGRIRFPGPEKVAASGVSSRRLRFFRFPSSQEVSVISGSLFDLLIFVLVFFFETSSRPEHKMLMTSLIGS